MLYHLKKKQNQWCDMICGHHSSINDYQTFNPLRAKFLKGNRNIYLHFMSFLQIDMTQEIEILPQGRQGPTYST